MKNKGICVLMMMLVITLWSAFGFAEAACKICGGWGHASAYGRLFDPKTVNTVSGEILTVNKIAPLDTEDYGISFLLDTGKDEVFVHLGPLWYVESEPLKFEAGDKVVVSGSHITLEGDRVIVVTKIKKGDKEIALRSDLGQPAWSGWKKN